MRQLSPKTSALSQWMCLCLFTKARSRKEHVRSAGLPYILPRESADTPMSWVGCCKTNLPPGSDCKTIDWAWLDFVKLFAWLIIAKLCLQFYETIHEVEWNIQLFFYSTMNARSSSAEEAPSYAMKAIITIDFHLLKKSSTPHKSEFCTVVR